MQCIPSTTEKYISFSLGQLRFIDSLAFMNASLDSLVNNLYAAGDSKFNIVKQIFPKCLSDLLFKKGLYPYEYIDSEARFSETCLPPKEKFNSFLTPNKISCEDYAQAQETWKTFNIQNLGEYHDHYLKLDVALLADIFENFREMADQYFKLDPCHYFTSPGLSWSAMLKMTEVKLELLTDIDKHLFIEQGVRGGLCMISNRYAEANNKYLPGYASDKDSSFLVLLDVNNLYGAVMEDYLPKEGFKWVENPELLDINKIGDKDEIGYVLEVDLEYPVEIHDAHSDYPLAPEKMKITSEMLSSYSHNLLTELGIKEGDNVKLVATLNNKSNYIIHYRNLKLYLNLGMKVTKIHKALQFTQEPWLKKYISFNTEKRIAATNAFQKDFHKLLNNSIYGKCLQNPRKHLNFELVHKEKRLKKLIASPSFEAFVKFNDDLIGVSSKKKSILLDKPCFVGFTILELSKHLMYDFFYHQLKVKYNSRVKLMMTDTDSFLIQVQTDDFYKDMMDDLKLYDTSDYPPSHPCFSKKNKKVLGKMKDETNSNPIKEFVGLKSKMYSFIKFSGEEKKVAKGVPRVAIKNDLKYSQYKSCLFNKCITTTAFHQIESEKHILYTSKKTKLALSPFDTKRYVMDDGITTRALGHFKNILKRKSVDKPPEEIKRQKINT